MTFTEWMAARKLLFEEHIGAHLRGRENKQSADYAVSVARLRAAQAREQKQET